jgi:two-component system, OmpR family, sensor histidine kinase KdpD
VKQDAVIERKPDSFLRMIRRSQRGRLKIYLGYGAGVGKTYQMLLEGHRLKAEGIDVVVGLVETHGRADTINLTEGLEIVPRHREEYRGVVLEEMDVDAVLARKPEVALIDELAHTNAPRSRNPKRYQDVQDILAAGIHVITTLNIQHLETLYDTVEKTIGVKVRERLPDTVVAEADEIVDVDLTPEDLRKRLLEGKIYPADRIRPALDNFFSETNLEALRELALRELAAQIDLRRRGHTEAEEPAAPDQVMACLSSRGPNSEALLRYSSRLAGRLNRNWYAVYVQTPSEAPTVVDSYTQRLISGSLTLAKQLGAVVFTYKGDDVADTILRFAKEYRVGHIVIGSPGRMPLWQRLLGRRNVVERLVEKARGVTIVVLDTRPRDAESTKVEQKAHVCAATVTGRGGAGDQPMPAPLLPIRGIRIWDRPVSKEFLLRELIQAVAEESGLSEPEPVLAQVMKREQESSTFFNEGVAFPHVRLCGLREPIIALGIAKYSLADVITEKPVHLVFFILSPEERPEVQIQMLAVCSRAARDRHLLQRVTESRTEQEALDIIRAWEEEQTPRTTPAA